MSEELTVTCELIDNINSYYLLGMDKYFNNYKLKELDTNKYSFNKNEYKEFENFKLAYVKDNKIYKINDEVELKVSKGSYNNTLKLFFIESYQGISIQISNKDLYDKYLLYEIIDGNKEFILDTKDVLILSDVLKENHIYYVEAYTKYDDYFLLSNTSDECECVFKSVNIIDDLLTICIPVYNGETFIPRTLDSVILSSYDKYNILIINDGSTDNTKDVIDWYSNKYNFIKVIHNDNHGVSYTRNMLIQNVETPYMAFLDADDIVRPNMYKLLMDTLIETNSDISICKTIVREDLNESKPVLPVKCDKYRTYTYDEMAMESIKNTYDNIYFVALWNKVIKTEIVKKVKFTTNKWYEDSAFTPAVYSYVNKFVFVAGAVYYWDKRKRITEGTYSTIYNKVSFDDVVKYFLNATVYPVFNCNPNNNEFIIYNCLSELIDYYGKLDPKKELSIQYKNKLIDLIHDISIDNKYLKADKDLYFKVSCFKNL